MAVLALAAVGGAIGGSLGGALGLGAAGTAIAAGLGQAVFGSVGSYIDSTLLFPAIFGKDKGDLHGPRIDDFQLTTAAPGSPMYYCVGAENRIPGSVIWISPVKKVEDQEDVGGKGGGSVTTYRYFCSVAIALADANAGPLAQIEKIWADGKILWDRNGGTPKKHKGVRNITFYNGSPTQTPDPTIESYEGAGSVPAFRGTAYVVLEHLALHRFGNRLPNFNFLLNANPATIDSAVTDIMTRANRSTDDFDVVQISDAIPVRGYAIVGPQAPAKQLEPLLLAYGVAVQEFLGILYFRYRKDIESIAVDTAKMASREEGGSATRLISVNQTPDLDLPKEVNVQYIDPDLGYQKSSQREQRINNITPTTSSVEIPLVLSGNDARTLAKRTLWGAWAERNQVSFTLPPSYLTLVESDVLTFAIDVSNWRIRVTKVRRGNNYLVEVEGVTEQAHTLVLTATAPPPQYTEDDPDVLSTVSSAVVMDLPQVPGPTTPDYQPARAFAIGMAQDNQETNGVFTGAAVYTSKDSAGPYTRAFNVLKQSKVGVTTTQLSSTPPPDVWDRTSTVTVTMAYGTLESKTEAQVLNGENHLFVSNGSDGGGEVIGFTTAALTGPGTYVLSGLVRGRRDTTDKISGHAIGDKVALLDSSLVSGTYNSTYHQTPVYFKVVPSDSDIDDVSALGPYTPTSRNIRPFSPCHLRGWRNNGLDLTVSWLRRSPAVTNVLALTKGAPRPEPTEEYDVEFWRVSDTSLRRTVRVSDQTTHTYPADLQTADGITPGVLVLVKVYQVNINLDASGRGNAASATL